jgi:hypothetical protein
MKAYGLRFKGLGGPWLSKSLPFTLIALLPSSGAGETLVEAILEKYPTWHHLWAAYKEAIQRSKAVPGHPDPFKAAEGLLAALPVGGAGLASGPGGGCRTVGGEVSRKVFNSLFRSAPSR